MSFNAEILQKKKFFSNSGQNSAQQSILDQNPQKLDQNFECIAHSEMLKKNEIFFLNSGNDSCPFLPDFYTEMLKKIRNFFSKLQSIFLSDGKILIVGRIALVWSNISVDFIVLHLSFAKKKDVFFSSNSCQNAGHQSSLAHAQND